MQPKDIDLACLCALGQSLLKDAHYCSRIIARLTYVAQGKSHDGIFMIRS